jgi:hypothetical protein
MFLGEVNRWPVGFTGRCRLCKGVGEGQLVGAARSWVSCTSRPRTYGIEIRKDGRKPTGGPVHPSVEKRADVSPGSGGQAAAEL